MTMPTAPGPSPQAEPPLVVHVVYRFDTGGLENGVANLINHMPPQAYRHAVVAITEVVPGFAARIRREGVRFASLHKAAGHGAKAWPGLLRVLRELQPAIVHTRNLAALEMQPVAWWAGVRGRVHGEHGRDVEDLDGSSRKHQWIRRAFQPFVHRTIALSKDLQSYLEQRVGLDRSRVAQIYNGVDTRRFCPADGGLRVALDASPFNDPSLWVVGAVGRMQTVKDQPLLARAFVEALRNDPDGTRHWRLVMVGEGPLRAESETIVTAAGLGERTWFAGERADVPNVMRSLSCFVLPSLAEGISNTILEAMASGLPVVATRVGGNAELVQHGVTGLIVPPADPQAMAAALRQAASEAALANWGRAGRAEVERRFSLDSMVAAYQGVYDDVLRGRGLRPTH
jgi:sugar transferase (PEP-CTERM/EpsH1 system associated)